MDHEAVLEFEYEGPETAEIVAKSVDQEIGDIESARTQTTLERNDSTVTITIDAPDITGLRASLTTWNTLVEVAEQVCTD